jgi:hypothetical protein
MKKFTAHWIFAALLIAGISLCGCSKRSSAGPDAGVVTGRNYTNSFFAFAMTLPEDWPVAGSEVLKRVQEAGHKMMSKAGGKETEALLEAAEPNIRYLLMITEKPYGAPVAFNSSIIFMSERLSDVPGVKTGEDYLFQVDKMLRSAQMPYQQKGAPEKVLIGGKTFYRATYTATMMGQTLVQSYATTMIKEHALSIILTAGGDDQLKQMTAFLDTVKFAEP